MDAEAGDASTGAEAVASFLFDADADDASNNAGIGARDDALTINAEADDASTIDACT